MLFSGEFHPFRLPVPELWVDVLQKYVASLYLSWYVANPLCRFKAAGLNTVSVYCESTSA